MANFNFLTILVFTLLLTGCVEKPPLQGGFVAVNGSVHDFGLAKQKEELFYTFVLTNEASVPIFIAGLKSSCGCTWAEDNGQFVGSTLKPNDTFDFPVFLNTGTSQNHTGGKISISYRHQTDDPKLAFEGKLLLEVAATIQPDYRFEPEEIDFGNINGLDVQKVKTTFQITPDQLKSLKILEIKPSVNNLTARILSSKESGYEIETELDVSSFTESRAFRGHLIVETNSEILPKGIVQVIAQYIAPVNVQPSSIIIASDKDGIVGEEILIFTSSPAQLLRVDCGYSGLIRAVSCYTTPAQIPKGTTASDSGTTKTERIDCIKEYQCVWRVVDTTPAGGIPIYACGTTPDWDLLPYKRVEKIVTGETVCPSGG